MNSKEIVEKLNSIIREYPNAKIRVNIDNDLCDDEYASSFGSIRDITISNTWDSDGEYVYVDDEIEDELRQSFEMEPEAENMSDEEIDVVVEKEYNAKVASGEIKKEIIIWIS